MANGNPPFINRNYPPGNEPLPPWEKENHRLKMPFWGGYVNSLEVLGGSSIAFISLPEGWECVVSDPRKRWRTVKVSSFLGRFSTGGEVQFHQNRCQQYHNTVDGSEIRLTMWDGAKTL